MLIAKLDNKVVALYELYNEHNEFDFDYEIKLRKASKKGDLCCAECGGKIMYCHGEIQRPHFRHRAMNDCSYAEYEYQYSKEYLQSMQIINLWLKQQFEPSEIKKSITIPGTRYRPGFTIESEEKFFIDYFRADKDIEKFTERAEKLQKIGYTGILFFSAEKFYKNHLGKLYTWVSQNCLKDGIAYFLDLSNKTVIMHKIVDVIHEGHIVKRSFVSREIELNKFNLKNKATLIQKLLDDADAEVQKQLKTEINQNTTTYTPRIKIKNERSKAKFEPINFPYNKERYRELLLEKFCKGHLLSGDVYELMSYIKENREAFLTVFPDKEKALRHIDNTYLGKCSQYSSRIRFMKLQELISEVGH